MLRKGCTGLLRQALQFGLQQPGKQQQSCVQLQVLSLQAVRFRSKPSLPKHRSTMHRGQKQKLMQQHVLERALDVKGLSQLGPFAPEPAQAVAAAAAAAGDSSSAQASPGSADQQAAPAAADAQAATASSSDDSSSSGGFPTWIRGLLGDNRRRRARAPAVKASPLTPTAAVKDEQSKREFMEKQERAAAQQRGDGSKGTDGSQAGQPADGWGDSMALFKDLALDDYGAFIKNDPNADDFEGPPRPKTPMRGHTAFYGASAFDQPRVQYVRWETQHLLISAMSQEDKLRVKLNPKFHKDAAAMQELSEKTGFSLDNIRDVVVTFHKHRLEFKLLHDYRNSGGQMPPPHDTMQFETLKRRLVSQHEAEKSKQLLEMRDKSKCELRNFNAFVTKAHMRQICPQTELPYGQCCGANSRLSTKAARKSRRLLSAA